MAMERGVKRKPNLDGASSRDEKKLKQTKKQWRVPRRNESTSSQPQQIESGISGIWATCHRGKEGKCVGELRDLFNEYAATMYGFSGGSDIETVAGPNSIEDEIEAEIAGLHRSTPTTQLFIPIKLGVPCVVFFKTISPVEPVSLVKKVCEDAMSEAHKKRTRFVQRLSPTTLTGRASPEGLERVATEVLAPHFHRTPFHKKTFAIRPSLRNHNTMTRDGIIQQVAGIVGPGHGVDLKNYDLLIIVEVYQNVCGVGVVDQSFERLKRYNLAEIFDPTLSKSSARLEGAVPEVIADSESAIADIPQPQS